MSDRLKMTLTIFGPLFVLFTAMLDARLSAALGATALIVFGIWIVIDVRTVSAASKSSAKSAAASAKR